MTEARGSVPGAHNEHRVVFYGLSTCVWCKRTRSFLEDSRVAFDYVYVDLLNGQERDDVKEQVRKWNPAISFPTIIVNDSSSVIGFRQEELKGVLGL